MSKKTWMIGCISLLIIVGGILYGLKKQSGEDDFLTRELSEARSTEYAEPSAEETEERTVTVHVCGAVLVPGVYCLPAGSRVADALSLAGGLLPEAADSYVNLARALQDEEQLYFPTKEEAAERQSLEAQRAEGKVNINTAGQAELQELPGIGPSLAQAIMDYRLDHGGFGAAEELMQVPGIKQATYAKLKPYIVI